MENRTTTHLVWWFSDTRILIFQFSTFVCKMFPNRERNASKSCWLAHLTVGKCAFGPPPGIRIPYSLGVPSLTGRITGCWVAKNWKPLMLRYCSVICIQEVSKPFCLKFGNMKAGHAAWYSIRPIVPWWLERKKTPTQWVRCSSWSYTDFRSRP